MNQAQDAPVPQNLGFNTYTCNASDQCQWVKNRSLGQKILKAQSTEHLPGILPGWHSTAQRSKLSRTPFHFYPPKQTRKNFQRRKRINQGVLIPQNHHNVHRFY